MEKIKHNIQVNAGKTRMGMENIKESAEGLFAVVQRLDQGISAALDKGKQTASAASATQSALRKMKKALAGFDELQILKMPKSSSGGSGRSSSKKEETQSPEYLEIIQELMEIYGDACKDLQSLDMGEEGLLGYLWDALFGDGSDAPTVQLPIAMEQALGAVTSKATQAKGPVDDVTLAAMSLDQACGSVSGSLQQWKGKATEATNATRNMKNPLETAKQSMKNLGSEGATLASKLDGIRSKSDESVSGVKTGWSGVSDWFKNNVGNKVIVGANGMLGGIVGGVNAVLERLRNLNLTIPDWIPFFGGHTISFGSNSLTFPPIPFLASGAVLPANRPFLAVVGDQKNGTNVEAPLATIKQAVAEVLGDSRGGDITVRFDGDLAQLARVLQPVIYREDRRVGSALVRREVL